MVGAAGGKSIPCAEYGTFGSQELSDGIVHAMEGGIRVNAAAAAAAAAAPLAVPLPPPTVHAQPPPQASAGPDPQHCLVNITPARVRVCGCVCVFVCVGFASRAAKEIAMLLFLQRPPLGFVCRRA